MHRDATPGELRLLQELARRAIEIPSSEWLTTLRVKPLRDGGMGSLELQHSMLEGEPTEVGKALAELQFTDADNVEVIVTLNGNANGVPLELDVWKTDFTAVARIPEEFGR